jgi:hypothetical protein
MGSYKEDFTFGGPNERFRKWSVRFGSFVVFVKKRH